MNKLLRLTGLLCGVAAAGGCGGAGESLAEPGARGSLSTNTQAVTSSQWSSSSSMGLPREMNTVTLLDSGLVLVSGGFNISARGATTVLSLASLYNPYSNTWQSTGGLNTPRFNASFGLILGLGHLHASATRRIQKMH